MRLDKFLKDSGIGSRKEVKKIIKDKRIKVNDNSNVSPSDIIDEDKDKIYFDDALVEYHRFHYLLLNKPEGYLSATEDRNQATVLDLVKEFDYVDLFPVGRLDKDTTGCLLLTNNGSLAHRLLSPKYHVDKVYLVEIDKPLLNYEQVKDAFKKGIPLDDELTLPASLSQIDIDHYELTIHQGKFHQVKRMFEYFGYKVIHLHRKQFAFLNVSDVPVGQYRILKEEEIEKLKSI